jgi:hypothetical protein
LEDRVAVVVGVDVYVYVSVGVGVGVVVEGRAEVIDINAIKARLARVAGKWPTAGVMAPGADEFGPKAWSAHGPLRCHATETGSARSWTQANADADFIAHAPTDIDALVAEVERLRALEADAERARVKADLWSYYEALVAANGAGSITELVVQRDAARAEAAEMRAWAEEAARAENENAEDARRERVAVVEWLRAESRVLGDAKRLLAWASTQVERGEHRREEEK